MSEPHRRICLDTNVVLDVLLDRAPFSRSAALLIDAVAQRRLKGVLGATTLTTIDFILTRHRARKVARTGLAWLLSIFDIAAVDRSVLNAALQLGWLDFEDAVLHEAAHLTRATALVTRNTLDFRASALPVYTPEECLAILARG
jgi:predicted nucleic acid-binding protein